MSRTPPPIPSRKNLPVKIAASLLRAKANFPYHPSGQNDGLKYLALNAGDVIVVLSKSVNGDSNWMEGTCKGQKGIFPANYVTLLKRNPMPSKPKPKTQPSPLRRYDSAPSIGSSTSRGRKKPSSSLTSRKPLKQRSSSNSKSSTFRFKSSSKSTTPGVSKGKTPPQLSNASISTGGEDPPELPKVQVLYKYIATSPDELSVHPGMVVFLEKLEVPDAYGFSLVSTGSGQKGKIPSHFIDFIGQTPQNLEDSVTWRRSVRGIFQNVRLGVDPLATSVQDIQTNDTIWNEAFGSLPPAAVFRYKQNVISGGSVNKLLQLLVTPGFIDQGDETKTLIEQRLYTSIFLMTYRSFITPLTFLKKMIEALQLPKKSNPLLPKFSELQVRIAAVVKELCKSYPDDFTSSDEIPKILSTLISKLQQSDPNTIKIQEFSEELKANCVGFGHRVPRVMHMMPSPEPKILGIIPGKPTILDFDSEEVARQLSLIDFDLFYQIRPSELLQQGWAKRDAKTNSPNVLNLIHRTNDISRFVSTTIVTVLPVKKRAKIFAKWIEICQHTLAMNNYNTLLSIMAGLANNSVHRLEWTKSDLTKKQWKAYQDLEAKSDTRHNFKVLREALATSPLPCLPFLGMFLTDLTFVDDGNPDQLKHDTSGITPVSMELVNWGKRKQTYDVITGLLRFQDLGYHLTVVSELQDYLMELPGLMNDEELYNRSLFIEPRNAEYDEIPDSEPNSS